MTPHQIKMALAVVLLTAGCGTPAVAFNPTPAQPRSATPPGSLLPPFPPATKVPDPQPGSTVTITPGSRTAATQPAMSANDGMVMPTQPPHSGPVPTESGYVLLWELYGTPTATVVRTGNKVTAAPGIAQVNTATTPPTLISKPTSAPTEPRVTPGGLPTLPPTATRIVTATHAPASDAAAPAAALSVGDPQHGKILFNGTAGCVGCHDVLHGVIVTGPSLKGVAARAAARKPGMNATDYLRESIRQPNAFVVPGFAAGIMLQNYGQTFSGSQIDDLVAYLLTLK